MTLGGCTSPADFSVGVIPPSARRLLLFRPFLLNPLGWRGVGLTATDQTRGGTPLESYPWPAGTHG